VSVGVLRFLMTRLTGFAKPVEDSKASLRDMRAVAVVALGEALVRAELEALGWPMLRAELEALGWPMLRNVTLGAPGRSVEIDQLARAPGGVIVLETKTYSGHVDGELGSECWILSLRDGRSFVVPTRLFRTRPANQWLMRRRHNPRHNCAGPMLVDWRDWSWPRGVTRRR